jgi:uncharacterized protein (TIGR02217 family)
MASDFHEVRFPLDVSLGSRGGPVRRTDIVTLSSGREHRNSRWALSRRRYDAGLGVRTIDALHAVIGFFEERRGRLHGFRFRNRTDWRSGPPSKEPTPLDQRIGAGDGATLSFQLVKSYGSSFAPYRHAGRRLGAGCPRRNRAGCGAQFNCDPTTGVVMFITAPPAGAVVTAGFAFDVPVRFDADELDIDLSAFDAGEIPRVPLIEIVP